MRQSVKEMTIERGLARLLQPERREAGVLPTAAESSVEFGSEPGMRSPNVHRVGPVRR